MILYYIIGIVSAVFITLIIWFIINRQCDYVCNLTDQRITAKQFFSLYSIAPERWSFDEFNLCAVYKRDLLDRGMIENIKQYGTINYQVYEYISFKTYFGALKVRQYFRGIEARKHNANVIRHRAELIKAWQEDISEFKENTFEFLKPSNPPCGGSSQQDD